MHIFYSSWKKSVYSNMSQIAFYVSNTNKKEASLIFFKIYFTNDVWWNIGWYLKMYIKTASAY